MASGTTDINDRPLARFCRGFLGGSAVGTALLAFGLVSWGVAVLVGADKGGAAGMSLMPIYVLSFGLAGGVVMFRAEHVRNFGSVLVWVFAVAIVMTGCFVMV